MIARSLDVYVWLKLCGDRRGKTYAQLGKELGMSASEVHAAVRRGGEAGLVKPDPKRVVREAFVDYLLHGVRYAFPAVPGRVVRGMPTGYSAPCLAGEFAEVQSVRAGDPARHVDAGFLDRCVYAVLGLGPPS